jgi:cation transport regulator ChaB
MKQLPKEIYEQLSKEGKELLVSKLKSASAKRKTDKVRKAMANDIAKKVVSLMKPKRSYKKSYSKRSTNKRYYSRKRR